MQNKKQHGHIRTAFVYISCVRPYGCFFLLCNLPFHNSIPVIVLGSGVKRKRKKLDERGKTSKEAKQRKEQPKMSSKNSIANLEE